MIANADEWIDFGLIERKTWIEARFYLDKNWPLGCRCKAGTIRNGLDTVDADYRDICYGDRAMRDQAVQKKPLTTNRERSRGIRSAQATRICFHR